MSMRHRATTNRSSITGLPAAKILPSRSRGHTPTTHHPGSRTTRVISSHGPKLHEPHALADRLPIGLESFESLPKLDGTYGIRDARPLADGSGPGITPEVKQSPADEVTRQVKSRIHRSPTECPAQGAARPARVASLNAISDHQTHTFVVASDLDLVDPTGRRCMISEGDVVQVVSGPQPSTGTASAVVLASKGGIECGRAAQVEIALTDLQEMAEPYARNNRLQGMANTNAAKGAASVTPEFAKEVPLADANAGHEIEQEQQLAAAADGWKGCKAATWARQRPMA